MGKGGTNVLHRQVRGRHARKATTEPWIPAVGVNMADLIHLMEHFFVDFDFLGLR
jgi:hypothetical protein